MRMVHFVDTAGSDEAFVPSGNILLIQITSATNINVYWASQDPAVTANDKVALTCVSGYTDEVAKKLANYMTATNIGGASVLTVDAANFDANLSTVAYTAGA
jgi:uncharacterized membrane protein